MSGRKAVSSTGLPLYRVRASGEKRRVMPFFSLNRIRSDRQTALSSAWQRRMGLPEGAPLKPRLNASRSPIRPFPHFSTAQQSSAWSTASPRAAVPCACRGVEMHRRNKPGGGHSDDGVPHAEEPSTTDFDSASSDIEARAQAFAGSTLVVSSALASAYATPPM